MIHCPTCDAGLRFEIETQQMACDHCGNRFDVDQVSDNEKHDAKGSRVFDLYVFSCPECGAELAVGNENDAVGFCPYCGGASMLFNRVRQSWVPDGVIPFKVTKEQCKEAYVNEVRKHPFVSRKYRDAQLIDSFRGIYMPYWQFVGKQTKEYKVEGTETVGGSKANTKIERTYVQWYQPDCTISGFSHDASSNFDDHTSERLAPYDDSELKAFHSGYLNGFYAEIGDMDQATYEQYAKERCQDFTASKLPVSMTHAEKRDIETEISSLTNVLYPVWFMSYRRGDKISYAAVNGETGRVSADLPLSPLRLVGAAVILAVLLFVLFNIAMSVLPSIKVADVLKLCAVIAFASACFLNESRLGTLQQSLRLSSRSRNNNASANESLENATWAVFAVFVTLLAAFGTLFVAIDGSYDGLLRRVGFYMSLAGYAALVVWVYDQMKLERKSKAAIMSSRTSQLENGIAEAYANYRVPFSVLKAVTLISCIIALLLGMADVLGKPASFGFCIILAGEVLAYAALQIVFQVTIAEHKPPQMSKGGALYDTN